MLLLSWIYALAIAGLAVFGFNFILMGVLATLAWLRTLWTTGSVAPAPDWPSVLVQLPVFNERYVVERLIDAVAALDYPSHLLIIQVLDDSTDDTAAIARARAAYYRARGRQFQYHHRTERTGFKAGALAEGLSSAPGEFVAVFDADFVPPPDFLRRTVPELFADPRLGMVQARWEHLNAEQHGLTRAEALACDSYFAVDQMARSRAGLLLSFNGSAGVWRRACIEDAGGWQGDTLAEDLDLSYRAQLNGWRMGYLPDVTVPAELTPSILALKQQQFRWAKGSFQVLRKLGSRLLKARQSLVRTVLGFLHLCGYLPHPLMFISLLMSLPVVLRHGLTPLRLDWLGWVGFGPPLVVVLGQIILRKDWPKRLVFFPVLVLIGIGLTLTNTVAICEAFVGRNHEFVRTPKVSSTHHGANAYALPVDWTTWGELLLALYALATGLLAVEFAPGFAPFIFLYALGFGYTAALGFWESGGVRQAEWPVTKQLTNDK